MKNPVAKNAPEFNKARVFRDRKTHAKETGDYKEHHKLAPYVRCPTHNLLLEWEEDDDEDEARRQALREELDDLEIWMECGEDERE